MDGAIDDSLRFAIKLFFAAAKDLWSNRLHHQYALSPILSERFEAKLGNIYCWQILTMTSLAVEAF